MVPAFWIVAIISSINASGFMIILLFRFHQDKSLTLYLVENSAKIWEFGCFILVLFSFLLIFPRFWLHTLSISYQFRAGCNQETYDRCTFWCASVWRTGLITCCCCGLSPFGWLRSFSTVGITIAYLLHWFGGALLLNKQVSLFLIIWTAWPLKML